MEQPQQCQNVALVLKALAELDRSPMAAEQLLREAVAASSPVGVKSDEVDLAARVSDLLQHARKSALDEQATWEASWQESEAELGARRAALASAMQEAARAEEERAAKAAADEEASRAQQEAEVVQKKVKNNAKGVQASLQDLRDSHSKVLSLKEGAFMMLESGGWGDEDMKAAALDAVLEFLTEIRAEKPLLIAAPFALGTTPGSRVTFDHLTVQWVADLLDKKAAELDAQINKAAPEKAHLEAEALGVWAISDCARDTAEVTEAAVVQTNRAQKRAAEVLEQANLQVQRQELAIEGLSSKRLRIEAHLQEVEAATAALEKLSAAMKVVADAPEAPIAAEGEAEAEAEEEVSSMEAEEAAPEVAMPVVEAMEVVPEVPEPLLEEAVPEAATAAAALCEAAPEPATPMAEAMEVVPEVPAPQFEAVLELATPMPEVMEVVPEASAPQVEVTEAVQEAVTMVPPGSLEASLDVAMPAAEVVVEAEVVAPLPEEVATIAPEVVEAASDAVGPLPDVVEVVVEAEVVAQLPEELATLAPEVVGAVSDTVGSLPDVEKAGAVEVATPLVDVLESAPRPEVMEVAPEIPAVADDEVEATAKVVFENGGEAQMDCAEAPDAGTDGESSVEAETNAEGGQAANEVLAETACGPTTEPGVSASEVLVEGACDPVTEAGVSAGEVLAENACDPVTEVPEVPAAALEVEAEAENDTDSEVQTDAGMEAEAEQEAASEGDADAEAQALDGVQASEAPAEADMEVDVGGEAEASGTVGEVEASGMEVCADAEDADAEGAAVPMED